MKYLFTIFFIFLLTVSCSVKKQSKLKLSISNILLSGENIPGGVMLYGKNNTTNEKISISLKDNQSSLDMSNGDWDFLVMGWYGANNMEGAVKCGGSSLSLNGGTSNLSISISAAKCTSPDVATGKFLTANTFKTNLDIYNCKNLPASPDLSVTVFCDDPDMGNIQSLRVTLFAQAPGTDNIGLQSQCYNFSTQILDISSLKIPIGDGTNKFFHTIIDAYDSYACTGQSEYFDLIQGFAFDDEVINEKLMSEYKSIFDISSGRIFLKTDSFLPHPPIIESISDQSVAEFVAITQINANDGGDDFDVDTDPITYTCIFDTTIDDTVVGAACSTLTGVAFDGATGVFDWTPDYTQTDTYEFKIVGTDGTLSDDEIFAITVTNFNRSPVLTAIADETVNENVAITQINTNDGGDDFDVDLNAVAYTCLFDTTVDSVVAGAACTTLAGVSFDGATGVFDWTPDYTQADTYEFKIVGTDGTLSDDEIFAITVNNVDQSPVTLAITPESFFEDAESMITLNYSDFDNDLGLSCTISDQMNITISTPCNCDGAGTCTVGVTGTTAYTGIAGFDYTVSANGLTSNTSHATLDILESSFVSVWRTTAASETITLPLRSGYAYSFTVNWGDGTPDSTITSFGDGDKVHTYDDAGDYTVTMTGTAEAWYFNNGGDKNKIISVTSFGIIGWTNLEKAFYGCSNLTSFTGGETITVTDMSYMFHGASALTSLDLSTFNTTAVTDMSFMFRDISILSSLDLTSFNTAAVTDMRFMFYGASALTSLDLSTFNTAAVTDMNSMFKNISALVSLNLNYFNTSAVTDMSFMFYRASSLTSLDLSSFNTAAVTNMRFMFYGTSSLISLNLNSFVTAAVTDMSSMFNAATSLTSLDLISFDTAAVTNMSSMFTGASVLTSLDISSFNTSEVSNMSSMFKNISILSSINLSNFNTTSVINMNSMFNGASGLSSLDLSTFNTAAVTDMSFMFSSASALTSIDLSTFDTSAVTDMRYMFRNASILISLDLISFNTAAVADMSSMFAGASALTSLDLSSFNTAAVINMNSMFNGASGLTSLNLSSFNTAAVTNMNSMFKNISALVSLNLNSFNTSAVTNMSNMFYGASALTSLDLNTFNTAAVINMSVMFYEVSSITSLDLSSFETAAVTNMTNMFRNTTSLITLNTTSWDIAAVTDYANIFFSTHASLEITCNDQDLTTDGTGTAATGTLFGETCT